MTHYDFFTSIFFFCIFTNSEKWKSRALPWPLFNGNKNPLLHRKLRVEMNAPRPAKTNSNRKFRRRTPAPKLVENSWCEKKTRIRCPRPVRSGALKTLTREKEWTRKIAHDKQKMSYRYTTTCRFNYLSKSFAACLILPRGKLICRGTQVEKHYGYVIVFCKKRLNDYMVWCTFLTVHNES